jgi:hypothetical protein
MFPREIASTSFWIQHNLSLSSPLSKKLTEDLRKQIRSRYGHLSDEMLQVYIRQKRTRLDLKWRRDEYFGWNISDPVLGQLVKVNLYGSVQMAYTIGVARLNITITPADELGAVFLVGLDDIYSAELSPFYEPF